MLSLYIFVFVHVPILITCANVRLNFNYLILQIHEAIMREESSQYAEGVVIEEFRRGFMLGDKLLRPSMVKVSSGAPATTTPDPVVAEGTPELVEEVAE